MVIKMTYGEKQEVTLDTAFSLSFIQKMVERGWLSSDFIKNMAAGDIKMDNINDFLNIPYCCYFNATQDPMGKDEFDERFIVDVNLIRNLVAWCIFGDMTGSSMKNVFRVQDDPKK